MHYQVSRNGQMYGPYTLEDLERYVASGNVLPTDLTKSETMPEWLPVAQVLGRSAAPQAAPPPATTMSAAPAFAPANTGAHNPPEFPAPTQPAYTQPAYTQPAYAQPAYAQPAYVQPGYAQLAASPYPDAPNLHWGLLLLIGFLFNLFFIIWDFVQAAWLKKVAPASTALANYITAWVLMLLAVVVAIASGVSFATSQASNQSGNVTPGAGVIVALLIAGLIYLGGLVMYIVARFAERAALEQHFNGPEPVGLKLSGVMTFFFGSLYFQYHLNRINALKQAARMGVRAPY